ncbi:hypothetical protein RP20_CCG017698 [Aedes albopictus]|nr:hypothetical protein RP20_CCG017698 [Aedes albopictus]
MDVDINDGKDRIGPMYRDRHVLITGGTGFMGKALIEKLLRCTEVAKIYLLVRTKKGKSPKARLEDMFSNPLFAQVIELRGLNTLLAQCVVIPGDVTEPELGISAEDRKRIVENVSIIYHCAATIRFDEALKKAVLLNTRGTKLMVELAKQCKKLEMFGHVSTSYCHLNEKLLMEKPYPPPADPHKVIKAVEWLEDDIVDGITKKILGECPNTYAYTKALGEAVVVEAMKDIPVVIFRPSIVVPTWREPISGWTDNINGPVGLLIGAGKGVIRSMYCNSTGYGDYLPVDFGVSAICVGTWNFIGRKLCRVHRRIANGFEVFEYYANNQWDFDNAGINHLRDQINEEEKVKFKIDAGGVEINEYFENCIWGARRFILKESDESVPAAKRHMRVMWCVDKICKTIIYGAFFYYFGMWLYNKVFAGAV